VNDPVWLEKAVVLAIHDEQMAEHGGRPGVRDMGLLESALDRPLNMFNYQSPDLVQLAACYGFTLARNHPFADGNKRTSAVVTELFLELNGFRFTATDAAVVTTWLALADGSMDENELVAWLRHNVVGA
jgi:death-on-curing protein